METPEVPETEKIKSPEEQTWVEKIFEKGLWNTRFIVILPVIFGLFSALVLFIIATGDIVKVVLQTISVYFYKITIERFYESTLALIIGAVDLYLIGIVLLIFSFGLYELFISDVDIARKERSSNALQIESLDQLKDKIIKVIIVVLVVGFFQRAISMAFSTPLEMLYLALSILAISFGLYFLHKRII